MCAFIYIYIIFACQCGSSYCPAREIDRHATRCDVTCHQVCVYVWSGVGDAEKPTLSLSLSIKREKLNNRANPPVPTP